MAEIAVDVVAQARKRDLLDLDGHRAGLDLRQVKNVVDQMQQVAAGRIDIARKLHLFGRQRAR